MVTSIKSSVLGCRFSMYLSYRNKIHHWAIGYSHYEHNCPMNSNPFSYFIHWTRRIRHDKALEIAVGLWDEVLYNKARRTLKKNDLKIYLSDKWGWYDCFLRASSWNGSDNIRTKANDSAELLEICSFVTPNSSALPNDLWDIEKPEPKKSKICKLKIVDVTWQLKELLDQMLSFRLS